MIDFALRNLVLFFKDRTAVILSFLAEFIVVGLYILFIRKNMITSFAQIKGIELLMDTWMIAGILGITSVTTTMGAYEGEKIGQGRENAKTFLATHPEVAEEVERKIRQHYGLLGEAVEAEQE